LEISAHRQQVVFSEHGKEQYVLHIWYNETGIINGNHESEELNDG